MKEGVNCDSITCVYSISYRDQLSFGLEVPGLYTSQCMTHNLGRHVTINRHYFLGVNPRDDVNITSFDSYW